MPQPPAASFAGSLRYVLLVLDDGTATVRGLVRRTLAHNGLSAEAVDCISVDEAVARLRSGRRYSAVVVASSQPGIDELSSDARRVATPILTVAACSTRAAEAGVVEDPEAGESSTPEALMAAVMARAIPIRRGDLSPELTDRLLTDSNPRSHLVAVCGPGGTGASVMAAGLAAYLGARPFCRDVLLADLALRADQAVLHHLPEQGMSLLDMIGFCRRRRPAPAQLRQLTIDLAGYGLLPGLRRPSHWTAVPPQAFDAALRGLRAAFNVIVADIGGEFEGETDVGSIDVEERNHMARQVALEADVVIVIGRPGAAGSRRLAMTIDALLDRGVERVRVQPVVNRVADPAGGPLLAAPRTSSTERTICLMGRAIRVPELAGVDTVPFPDDLTVALGPSVAARLTKKPAPLPRSAPLPVVTGSIGCWQGSQPA